MTRWAVVILGGALGLILIDHDLIATGGVILFWTGCTFEYLSND